MVEMVPTRFSLLHTLERVPSRKVASCSNSRDDGVDLPYLTPVLLNEDRGVPLVIRRLRSLFSLCA